MEITPDIIGRFVHDTVKPIKSMIMRLKIMDSMPGTIKDDKESLRMWTNHFESVAQALEDIRCLSNLSVDSDKKWIVFKWSDIIESQLRSLASPTFITPSDFDEDSFQSLGNSGHIRHALHNIAWFTTHFGNCLSKISLNEIHWQSRSSIVVNYEIQTLYDLDPKFSQLTPFFQMSRQSVDIANNTGLILFVALKIIELHGGTIMAKSDKRVVTLELICPLA